MPVSEAQAQQTDFQIMSERVRKIHPHANLSYSEFKGEALATLGQGVDSSALAQMTSALGAQGYKLITPSEQQRDWGAAHEQGKPFDGLQVYVLFQGIISGKFPSTSQD